MHHFKFVIPFMVLFGGLSACGETPEMQTRAADTQVMMKHITGQISYLERIALPPGARAIVKLEDISITDRAAPVLAEQIIEFQQQQVPVSFELNVDYDALKPRGRYSVRVTLVDPNGRLLFTTDTANLVDPNSGAVDMGLLMLRRNAVPPQDGDEDNMWMYSCGETNVAVIPGEDEIQIKVEGRSFELVRVISASGEKYKTTVDGEIIVFWMKGDNAFLEIGEMVYPECLS